MTGQHDAILAGIAVLAFLLFLRSLIVFLWKRNFAVGLRLIGAGSLMVVVLAHVCETFHLLTWMHWGEEHSAGHYLDLASASLGLILLPIGFLLDRPIRKPA